MSGTDIFSILGIAVTAAVSAVALKKYSPETSVVIAIAAGLIILVWVMSEITPIINEINNCIGSAGIDSGYLPVLLKSVGICFVCQFASDSCKDAGQTALASRVELASGITIVLLALPLIENILSTAIGLISD